MAVVQAVLAGLLGYALGAVPVGLLVGLAQGVDPRLHGSGRTGGTNVWRSTRSVPAALVTVAGDVAKGTLAVVAASLLFPGVPLAQGLAGIGAVAGHNWSVFIRFGGGAGTMTNFGVLFVLSPLTCLVIIPVALGSFAISRMASVASLSVTWAAFITLSLLAMAGLHSTPFATAGGQPMALDLVAYGLGQAALITYALRPNIRRLIRREERRVDY